MSKKRKAKAEPREEISLRIVRLQTQHGVFLRLAYVTYVGDKMTDVLWTHEYFQDPQEIVIRAGQMADAISLPVVDLVGSRLVN